MTVILCTFIMKCLNYLFLNSMMKITYKRVLLIIKIIIIEQYIKQK